MSAYPYSRVQIPEDVAAMAVKGVMEVEAVVAGSLQVSLSTVLME